MINITPFLEVLRETLKIWDWHNKTKYARKYEKIFNMILEEEAKPIYGDLPMHKLRDQAKIDKGILDLKILMERFLNERIKKD